MLTATTMANPANEIVELINAAAFDDIIAPGEEESMLARHFVAARCIVVVIWHALLRPPTVGKVDFMTTPFGKGVI